MAVMIIQNSVGRINETDLMQMYREDRDTGTMRDTSGLFRVLYLSAKDFSSMNRRVSPYTRAIEIIGRSVRNYTRDDEGG